MLTSWATRHRSFKKRIAWFLYQKRDLQTARVLHATSIAEAEHFRRLDLTQPIAIIPNGVEPPKENVESRKQKAELSGLRTPNSDLSAVASAKAELRTSARTVLFVGRIHPVKGLMNLIRAWAAIQDKAESTKQKAEISELRSPHSALRTAAAWRLVIAGGDEAGHTEKLKAESRELKLENSVEFVGPVEGAKKWELYRSADLFVLPSHSENFGLVVAEALASGVPVITTKGTPWQELETHRCGWWIDIGAEPLVRALREALSLSDAERQEMGARGRQLTESKYTWPKVAQQMKSVYEWVLGTGPRPECVLLKY